jgi:hypothetical protein
MLTHKGKRNSSHSPQIKDNKTKYNITHKAHLLQKNFKQKTKEIHTEKVGESQSVSVFEPSGVCRVLDHILALLC